MQTNRINSFYHNRLEQFAHPFNAPAAQAAPATGFAMFPMNAAQAAYYQYVYRIAYEQARIALEPPKYSRLVCEN